MGSLPQINFCRNILTIYEKSETFGSSVMKPKEAAT